MLLVLQVPVLRVIASRALSGAPNPERYGPDEESLVWAADGMSLTCQLPYHDHVTVFDFL